jgi:hypothetical protein
VKAAIFETVLEIEIQKGLLTCQLTAITSFNDAASYPMGIGISSPLNQATGTLR